MSISEFYKTKTKDIKGLKAFIYLFIYSFLKKKAINFILNINRFCFAFKIFFYQMTTKCLTDVNVVDVEKRSKPSKHYVHFKKPFHKAF